MNDALMNEISRRLPKRHMICTPRDGEDALDLLLSTPALPIHNEGAAFEAWILFIHEKSPRTKIYLDIAPQSEHIYENPHFKRFLYRLSKFAGMGYTWFSIPQELEDRAERFMEEFRTQPKVIRLPHSEASGVRGKGERLLQNKFSAQDSILHALPECGDAVLHQCFPIDLFWGEKKAAIRTENRVFPTASSLLDLWCIHEKELSIFHLSCQEPRFGVVSELFFYANWCNDCLVHPEENGVIVPRKPAKCYRGYADFFDGQDQPVQLEKVNACFLADLYHPALKVDFICEMLSTEQIHFHMLKYSCDMPLAFN